MDGGLTPASLVPLHWPERAGSLLPTGSEKPKGHVLKRHRIPGVRHTLGGDDPALSAEGGAEPGSEPGYR